MSVYDDTLEFKAALLRKEAGVMNQMAMRWASIVQGLQTELIALVERMRELEASGKTISTALLRQQDRYKALLVQAMTQVAMFADYVQQTTADGVRSTADQAVLDAAKALEVVSAGTVLVTFGTIDTAAITELAGALQDGSAIRNVLIKRFGDNWKKAEDEILKGMSLGYSPDKIAKILASMFTDVTLADALRIVRTETLRAYRNASMETYKQSGVVKQWKWLSAKDSKTCIFCAMMDGTKHPLSELFIDHPNGHCCSVPVVDGFPEAEWQHGRDWFENLSEADQERILGPGKFEAFKNGDLTMDDLQSNTQKMYDKMKESAV